MRWYLAADCFGRVGRMRKLRTNHHSRRGASITRGSARNCRRYGRNASLVGASGVPSWMRSTPGEGMPALYGKAGGGGGGRSSSKFKVQSSKYDPLRL